MYHSVQFRVDFKDPNSLVQSVANKIQCPYASCSDAVGSNIVIDYLYQGWNFFDCS